MRSVLKISLIYFILALTEGMYLNLIKKPKIIHIVININELANFSYHLL